MGVQMHPLDDDVALYAAVIAAKYGLKPPDAIVCATAIHAGCGFLLTNDPKLRRVEELKVLIIDDYV